MPDFNFAKGNSKRDEGTTGGSGRRQEAGHQRPVSAHARPQEPTRPSADASSDPARPSSPPAPPQRRSVLEQYPERDLSHLSGGPPPADDAAPPAEPQVEDAVTETAAAEPAAPAGSAAGAGAENSGPSAKWPLIALVSVVAFLVIVAFIWHVNPYPPLKDAIAGLFTTGEPAATATAEEQPVIVEEETVEPGTLRSWDYFIQVSSWKDLAKADLDAERFRAQGLDVIVESEFIPAKGGTYYRVRLGPYASKTDAEDIRSAYASVIPSSAFVDSTRLTEDVAVEEPAHATRPAASDAARPEGRSRGFDIVDEPMSGWAVKVSSFKDDGTARVEADKLLRLGYPSFITKKRLGAGVWYRVLVGPFSDKRDADRYMQLLNVTYGNEAYTVDLSTD